MDCVAFDGSVAVRCDGWPAAPGGDRFHWLDFTHDELAADPSGWRERIEGLSGVRVLDLHLKDAGNLQHPSYFDEAAGYRMLVFRKLVLADHAPLQARTHRPPAGHRQPRSARLRLHPIETRPATCFVFDQLLVTIRDAGSRTVDEVRRRLLDLHPAAAPAATVAAAAASVRVPRTPQELMLRLVDGMVDRYLELRQPLTDRVDELQLALFDRRGGDPEWSALLDARNELRRLESLCEEQHDALAELRDACVQEGPGPGGDEGLRVRIDDVIEHIDRVLGHARRLEGSLETAVQLHFAAVAHDTNRVVQRLTLVALVFGLLTLIAGTWGMNLRGLPFAEHPYGFAILVGAMGLSAVFAIGAYRLFHRARS